MSTAGVGPNEGPTAEPMALRCRYLRNNGMYIFSDEVGDGESRSECETTVYRCGRTMSEYGPDDDFVDGLSCRNTERSCYEPL